jgi:hypothetical protein
MNCERGALVAAAQAKSIRWTGQEALVSVQPMRMKLKPNALTSRFRPFCLAVK